MKSLLIFFSLCIFFCSCKSWENTLVENRKSRKEALEKERLLTTSVEMHRLLLEQGKLARDRGTSTTIKEYGDLMVTREAELVAKIETLSHKENLRILSRFSKKGSQALNQLNDLKDRDFDKKILKVISNEYKQDLDEIKKKTILASDPTIKALLEDQMATMAVLSDKIEIVKQDQAEKHFSMRAKYRAWNRGYMVSLILGQFLI